MLTETFTIQQALQPKVIKYYRVTEWGNKREYIHPDNFADGKIIHQLTGKRTINSITRELIRDLTNNRVTFTEVSKPSTLP